MTNKPREFWIERYNGNGLLKVLEVEPNIVSDTKIILNGVTMSAYTYFHVIEAGPVLEKIARLELALQKCKEQRGICTEKHENEPCRYQVMEKEIESILGR